MQKRDELCSPTSYTSGSLGRDLRRKGSEVRRFSMVLVLAAIEASILVRGGTAGGNSPSAKVCQKDGWQTQYRQDQTTFASEEDCVSYAANGGVYLVPSLTLVQRTFQPGEFNFSCSNCIGVELTGQGLLPGSTVHLRFFNWPSGSPAGGGDGVVAADGTAHMAAIFGC